MANVNKVMLLGRLGNQPELKYTPSNRAVTELRIAVNRNWTDKAGVRQEKTDWFGIEVWDKQAENCHRYLTKGREVFIEGRLTVDEWTDKDGQKRTKTKVVAEVVQFIGRADGASAGSSGEDRGGFEGGGRPAAARAPAPGMEPSPEDFGGPEDDIPF